MQFVLFLNCPQRFDSVEGDSVVDATSGIFITIKSGLIVFKRINAVSAMPMPVSVFLMPEIACAFLSTTPEPAQTAPQKTKEENPAMPTSPKTK